MKTNVIMKSEQDRELFGSIIRQETKTGFLNLSDLIVAYDKHRIENCLSKKNITQVLFSMKFRIWLEHKLNTDLPNPFMPAKFLKENKLQITTGARHTKCIWVHPDIWEYVKVELFDVKKNPTQYRFEEKFIQNLRLILDGIIEFETQKKVLNYRVDIYFPDINLCVEFDENAHKYKSEPDIDRQICVESNLGARFIRIKHGEEIKGINLILKELNFSY